MQRNMPVEFYKEKHHSFDNEPEAVTYLHDLLKPYFHILQEVQMRHLDGTRIRIDMLLLPRKGSPVAHRFGLIGVELKSGHKELRAYHKALKQAIDYRHSRVIDKRVKNYQDETPDFVFVFPGYSETQPFNSQWYRGSIRLAGMFNVGAIHEVYRWGEWALEFRVSDSPVWRSDQGIVGGINFGTARRRGAA